MAFRVKQDVRWLEIAVQYAAFVRIMDRIRDGFDTLSGAFGGERPLFDHLGEVLAFHVIHPLQYLLKL